MRPRWMRPAPCRRVARELQRYLDGESTADNAWRVARHLSACDECFADAEVFRTVKDALAELRLSPGDDALARLRLLVRSLTDPTTGR